MHSPDSNLTSKGFGRRQYGQGRYGVPVQIGGFGQKTSQATLKRLRLQQQRMLDDEEVAALMILQTMRGTNYGSRYKKEL